MPEKSKIKEIGHFDSYENGWLITFTNGAEDKLPKKHQKQIKLCPFKDQNIEFQCATYFLGKNDVKKLQDLA